MSAYATQGGHNKITFFLQSPAYRFSDSEDCYNLVVLFFRPPIFRRPSADFRETLPHDAVCPEIIYFL